MTMQNLIKPFKLNLDYPTYYGKIRTRWRNQPNQTAEGVCELI